MMRLSFISALLTLFLLLLPFSQQQQQQQEHQPSNSNGANGGELLVATLMTTTSTADVAATKQSSTSSNDSIRIAAQVADRNMALRLANSAIDNGEIDIYELEPNDEARLIDRLMKRYHGYGLARPVSRVDKTLDVSLLFVINEFLGIEELTGIMRVTAIVIATWQDDLLRWDPSEFNDLKAVPMRTRDVFLPTIVKDGNGGTQSSIFMTGAGQNDRDINAMVWVSHTGQIEAKVTNLFLTACILDLSNFPFDSQTCRFVFKSWRFNNKRITLHQASGQKLSEHVGDSVEVNINANANWVMSSITSRDTTLIGIGENFSAITYEVIATRRSDYYMWNVLMPSIAMAVLLLATFFMPFGPERSMFCITLVLTMNIFQQALNTKLPVTSEVIPYVRQTTMQVIIGILITIESAFIWWIAAKDKRSPVPAILRICIPALRKRVRLEKEKLAKQGLLPGSAGKINSLLRASKMADLEKGGGIINGMSASMRQLDMINGEAASIIASRRASHHSAASHRLGGAANGAIIVDDEVTLIGDEFIIWGEWLEVAQLIDTIMLIFTLGSMVFFPIFFYRHKYTNL